MCYLKKNFSKPLTKENAIKQLIMLSGKEHKQISGCSICYNGKILYSFYKTAVLKMRNLSKKEIKIMCMMMTLKSCGAYKFESKGYLLFSKVIGDQFTIQGLPLLKLLNFLLKKKLLVMTTFKIFNSLNK